MAAPVYEITARWAENTATQVASGDVVTSEWRINVNDDATAPSNEPADNVTFTTTVTNGRIASLPDLCLTTGVDPVSSISADGRTLVCNVGTKDQGTAVAVMVPVVVDGATGEAVSLVGEINGQPASVPEIPIQNPFGMDIRWGTGTPTFSAGDGGFLIDYQWTLSKNLGSDAGPQTLTYNLDIASPQGGAVSVDPQGCAPFQGPAVADGHPWSGGTHPANQMTSPAGTCTITQTGPTTFQLTITGINYDPANPPTVDSAGNRLPVDQVALASGSIWVRVNTASSGSALLTSNAPTYTSIYGDTAQDDESNNTESKAWTTPGTYSSGWGRGYTGSGGTTWDDTYRVAAGATVGQYMDTGWQLHTDRPDDRIVGMCSALDTRYVTFAGWHWGQPAAADIGTTTEYYVGNDPSLDPASLGYDPNVFNCGSTDGWTTTQPEDLSTVKAMRITGTQGQFEQFSSLPHITPVIAQTIKPGTPAGTDVWSFFSGVVDAPLNNWWNGTGCITPTPGSRYSCTTGFRDVLRIVTATPAIGKSVDRSVVSPGIPAVYTLTYSANGAGAIPATVDGFVIVDTLPAGTAYVPGSASPEPVVTTNGSGQQVLTWTFDGVATNANHALTYQAVVDDTVAAGVALTNTAEASYGGQTRTAAAQVTTATNGYTSIAKTTDQWFIANPDGSGDGEGSWTVTMRSQDPVTQPFTDTIDILPYNGDGRGTAFAGTYAVSSVDVAAGSTVYYTSADPAMLNDDPGHLSNGAAGTTTGNTVGWSSVPLPNPTAIRVIGGELAPGATTSFTVTITTDAAEPGDVWVNRAQGIAGHTELVMRTSEPLTMGTMYSVSLKKYVQDSEGVWRDANDVAEYPRFSEGDEVNYRVVVTNTGQGTLNDVVVSDDKQPELGAFAVDTLEPGEENAYVHEYSITLDEGGPDTLVNTACVSAPQPTDTEEPVQTSCDPAGLELNGDPAHEKELVSATPIGAGQWELVYGIDVTNTSTRPTSYDLADTLHFTDQATIASATVTAAPAGVSLAAPAWDGQGNTLITAGVLLIGNDDAGYAPHRYEVTVVADVPLQLTGAGSGSGAEDPTSCGPEGDDADRAFNNTSALTDATGDVEEDQACAPIPSIDITKAVSEGPVPNGDGTWTVRYDVVATNTGSFEGVYEVTDRMSADGDMTVVSGEVTTAPAGVTPSPVWTGLGAEGSAENVIAAGITLPGGVTHTYQVEVVVGIDPAAGGAPVITPCSAEPGGNGGLSNTAGIEHNDLTDSAAACIEIAFITIDKTISAGPTPNGDGTWTITYDLLAENIGTAAGDYDLRDQLRYGTGINIVSAEVLTTPVGVSSEDGWTGVGTELEAPENLIAQDVTLAASGEHTYQVRTVVEFDEATIDPAVLACPALGSGGSSGLANSASLSHNGIVAVDEVCAPLPLITLDKEISAGPTPNGDGTWTITYDLIAENTGHAEGEYDLVDQLRYGTGVNVESADVIATPEGVSDPAGWTGQGGEETDQANVVAAGIVLAAGSTHTYQVEVVVSLDADTVTAGALECPAPGSDGTGGLANTAGLTHNGETQDDDACASLPLIGITKSISGAVTPVQGQDGVYDASYAITVTNGGAGAGIYDLDDTLAAGEGVSVVGIQDVSTDAPDPVGINPGFDGVDDARIVPGQPIAAATGNAVVHTYMVTVRYALDLAGVEIPSAADQCATSGNGAINGALNNVATVTWNGMSGSDDECVRPGAPTLDKALVSADPVGDGKWEVVYDLTVGNVGTEATTYDLDDELLFAPSVSVDSVKVTGPAGITTDPGFDGEAHQRIVTDAPIIGLNEDGYAPHVYRVTVIANVPLHFPGGNISDDGTGSPACTVGSGSNTLEQGLNNAATLTDETGNTRTDTDCAPLPSIDIAKSIVGAPVAGADGVWTVTYEIKAINDGAAQGGYTLTDQLRFGAGIHVREAHVAAAPEGVTASQAWTGQGDAGSGENVVASDVALAAGGVHIYQVVVLATVDHNAADGTTYVCPDPATGGTGGFANNAGISHNNLTDTADACTTPDAPTPPVKGALAETGLTAGPIAMIGLALLLLGAGAFAATKIRRREEV